MIEYWGKKKEMKKWVVLGTNVVESYSVLMIEFFGLMRYEP